MYFLLQWLVQVTCGNDACTMIMNVFGYTAMGQLFVLLILLLMSIICVVILIAYGLNIHRTAYANAILGVERLYAALRNRSIHHRWDIRNMDGRSHQPGRRKRLTSTVKQTFLK
ncbi:hypothetical protein COOONC_28048 [Cooperia oncophora]